MWRIDVDDLLKCPTSAIERYAAWLGVDPFYVFRRERESEGAWRFRLACSCVRIVKRNKQKKV